GLCDTVADATPERLAAGTATGFAFVPDSPAAFFKAIERALTLYRSDPTRWLALMRTGMRQDWSWERSAAEYERLYERVVGGGGGVKPRGGAALAPGWVIERLRRKDSALYPAGVEYRSPGSAQRHPGL